MDDYALVFNAGSSSLKFCVYRRPAEEGWRLEARGQIDGIGTSPRLTAKDDAGGSVADEKLDASVSRRSRRARRARRLAPRPLRRIARARRGPSGRPRRRQVRRPLHRHAGGARRSAGAGAAGAAPSAVQPRRHRGGERAAARRAAGGVLRYELPPRPAGRGGTGAAAEGDSRRRRAALRLPRALVRVHRVGAARRWRRTSPTAA